MQSGASGLGDEEDPMLRGFPEALEKLLKKRTLQYKKALDDLNKSFDADNQEDINKYEKIHKASREELSKAHQMMAIVGDESDMSRQLGIYGEEAVEIGNLISKNEKAGVFQLLTADDEILKGIEVKEAGGGHSFSIDNKSFSLVDSDKDGIDRQIHEALEIFKGTSRSEEDIVELRNYIRDNLVKSLFEEIIGDAEADPREGFRMESWGHILFGTLMHKIKKSEGALAGDEKRGFENLLWTRRSFHFINSELVKGGDPKEIHGIAGKLLLSEDLDTIAVMEPNLSPAMSVVEREMAKVRADPKNGGRIPYNFFIPSAHGEYKPAELEIIVANRLREMNEKGVVKLTYSKEDLEIRREAERVAALAVKTMNVIYRNPEHVGMTGLAPEKIGEKYISYPFDKVPIRTLRLDPERFETWGRGREGTKPWIDRLNQFVQGGVFEEIPGEILDYWKVNPENHLDFGGPYSGSFWRSLVATEEQRKKGLALGVQLYDVEDEVKRLKKEGIEKSEKGLRIEIWEKVGKRLPTVVARFFPTLSLDELGEKATREDYFNLGKRLRDGIIDGDKKEFLKDVDDKVKKKFKEEEIWKTIEGDVDQDIESKFVKGRKGDDTDPQRKAEIDKREKQRKKELRLQIGAETAFNWMIAEKLGTGTKKDGWEEDAFEAWEKLHEKLTVYEEKALRDYINNPKGYEKGNQGEYQSVWDLVDEDELGLGFSKQEKEVLRLLTDLGVKGEARKGAERMAGVKFSFLPFMEDVAHEKAEWWKVGPRGVSRRVGGDAEFAHNTNQVMTKIDNGLNVFEDRVVQHRKQLAESFTELYMSAQHMGEEHRLNVIAAKADTIVEKLYKANRWASWVPGGFIADWGGPLNLWKSATLSSNAQRKFGAQALSMTPLELRMFFNDLRPILGNERTTKLLKKHKATVPWVIASLAANYGPFAIPVGVWSLAIKPFLDELSAYMKEDLMR